MQSKQVRVLCWGLLMFFVAGPLACAGGRRATDRGGEGGTPPLHRKAGADAGVICLVVRSDPAGATVFDNNVEIGIAPVRLMLAPGERRRLRFVKRGCRDAETCVTADDYVRGGASAHVPDTEHVLLVRLTPIGTARLVVTTRPAGAAVLVDGRRMGVTPLFAGEVPSGRRSLRLEHPECFPESVEVVLEPGTETRIHRVLRDKVVAFYEERIAARPAVLQYHADLIHYCMLKGNTARAIRATRAGLQAIRRPEAADRIGFFRELWRVHLRLFPYPDPEGRDGDRLRRVCLEIMQTALEQRLGDVNEIRKHLESMKAYDKQMAD